MTEQETEHYQLICKRPGMFVQTAEFNAICARILNMGEPLWTVLCLASENGWSSKRTPAILLVGWPGLVSWMASQQKIKGEEQKIAFLAGLLDEFYQFGKSFPHDTLLVCYLRYYEWLKSKSWYRDDSPHYIDPEILRR